MLQPRVHGHRGAPHEAPENTMVGFRCAIDLGVDAIEFDVHPTLDRSLVVIHDYSIDRTTSGSGLVMKRRLDEIRSLDAGTWFDGRFSAERVPVLSEVLGCQGVRFELELKGFTLPFLDAVLAEVDSASVMSRVEFTSPHTWLLAELRRRCPGATLGLLAADREPWIGLDLYVDMLGNQARALGVNVVHVNHRDVDDAVVDQFHDRGFLVHAADTPDGSAAHRVALAGVDQLSTSDVRSTVAVLRDGTMSRPA